MLAPKRSTGAVGVFPQTALFFFFFVGENVLRFLFVFFFLFARRIGEPSGVVPKAQCYREKGNVNRPSISVLPLRYLVTEHLFALRGADTA